MVPNVAGTGTSFKGASLYYLHDKRQAGEDERLTSERVAWTATRNLATDDPELAWKIMAATALDQDRLKAQAGVKATGRKSAAAVYAYSLAWHPEEADRIGKAEMLRAAEESIRVLGAEDRQVLIVAHNDEPHPHVHVMINRVSPVDGRMLGTSNDYRKLDAWALAYRRERGEEMKYCPARAEKAKAAQKRQEGQDVAFVRGQKSTPRGMQQAFAAAQAANDNAALRERDRQRAAGQTLAAATKAMYARHKKEWQGLSEGYKARKTAIFSDTEAAIGRTMTAIKDQFRPDWQRLYRRQWMDRAAFDARERRLSGKIENALAAIAHRREIDPESSRGFLSAALNFLASKKARSAALEKLHAIQKRDLTAAQRAEIGRAIGALKAGRGALLSSAATTFKVDRIALIERQAAEREANRKAWTQRRAEANRSFDTVVREFGARQSAERTRTHEAATQKESLQGEYQRAARPRRRRGLKLTRSWKDKDGGQ